MVRDGSSAALQGDMTAYGDSGRAQRSQDLRGGSHRSAGQIQRTNLCAGKVMDRHRRTTPLSSGVPVVLGAAYLDFAIQRQCGAGSVGSVTTLAPVSPGSEIHQLGLAPGTLVDFFHHNCP